MPTTIKPIYNDVIKVTQSYFGPATKRFIDRQVVNHLDKKPEQLGRQDLDRLIDWISLAMALLVEDELLIKRYIAELRQLAKN